MIVQIKRTEWLDGGGCQKWYVRYTYEHNGGRSSFILSNVKLRWTVSMEDYLVPCQIDVDEETRNNVKKLQAAHFFEKPHTLGSQGKLQPCTSTLF